MRYVSVQLAAAGGDAALTFDIFVDSDAHPATVRA